MDALQQAIKGKAALSGNADFPVENEFSFQLTLASDVGHNSDGPSPNLIAAQPDHYFLRRSHLVSVLGLSVLEEFALSALKKMRLWMGSLAHAFYFLADLNGPIRSNSRAPCYFFIDPSIQPDSIAPIQFSNLVFDLFGIHKRCRWKRPELFNVPRGS
jgi:hypothetical protein